MKVAIKIYQGEIEQEDGSKLNCVDIVVNNRTIVPFCDISPEQCLNALKSSGVSGWVTMELGESDLPHTMLTLVYHGDVEISE